MSDRPPSDAEGWGYEPWQEHDASQGQHPHNQPPHEGQAPHGGQPQQPYGGQPPYGQAGDAPTPWPSSDGFASPPQPQQPAAHWGPQPFGGSPGAYAYQHQPRRYPRSSQAVPALILSVLSIFFCCFLLSIPGTIMGKAEMNAIDEGRSDPSNRTTAQVAFILGLIITGINVLFWGFYVVALLSGLAV